MPARGFGHARWILPVLACALLNLVATLALFVGGLVWPLVPLQAPTTRVAMHLAALGWLTLLDFALLFQFVPLLTTRPLPLPRVALATPVLIEAGLAGMTAGFLATRRTVHPFAWCLPAGSALVLLGICVGAVNVLGPLFAAPRLRLPARFVLAGLGAILVTAMIGLSLALSLALPAQTPNMQRLLVGGIGFHALAGLGGWLGLTAMGISYEMLPIFLRAPAERGPLGETVFALGAGGVALAVLAGLARLWLPDPALGWTESAGWLAIGASVLLHLVDVHRLYRARENGIALHDRAAIGAFVSLAAALALGAVLFATGRTDVLAPPLVMLVLFGWLGGLALTQLHRLATLLGWLSRFRSEPPLERLARAGDRVDNRHGAPWFVLYFLSIWLAVLASLAGRPPLLRGAMAGATLASLGLVLEYLRAASGSYPHRRRPAPSSGP